MSADGRAKEVSRREEYYDLKRALAVKPAGRSVGLLQSVHRLRVVQCWWLQRNGPQRFSTEEIRRGSEGGVWIVLDQGRPSTILWSLLLAAEAFRGEHAMKRGEFVSNRLFSTALVGKSDGCGGRIGISNFLAAAVRAPA
jgi:hypothetical protein